VPALIIALSDDNSEVRVSAAVQLGYMKANSAVPALCEKVSNDSSVEDEASRAVYKIIMGHEPAYNLNRKSWAKNWCGNRK